MRYGRRRIVFTFLLVGHQNFLLWIYGEGYKVISNSTVFKHSKCLPICEHNGRYMYLWGSERNNPFGHLLIICANDRPLSGAVSMATTRLPCICPPHIVAFSSPSCRMHHTSFPKCCWHSFIWRVYACRWCWLYASDEVSESIEFNECFYMYVYVLPFWWNIHTSSPPWCLLDGADRDGILNASWWTEQMTRGQIVTRTDFIMCISSSMQRWHGFVNIL